MRHGVCGKFLEVVGTFDLYLRALEDDELAQAVGGAVIRPVVGVAEPCPRVRAGGIGRGGVVLESRFKHGVEIIVSGFLQRQLHWLVRIGLKGGTLQQIRIYPDRGDAVISF